MIAEIESVDLTEGLALLPPLFLTLCLWYKIAEISLPIRGRKSGQKGRKKKEKKNTSWLRREKGVSLAIFSLGLISPYQLIWMTIDPTTRHTTSAISAFCLLMSVCATGIVTGNRGYPHIMQHVKIARFTISMNLLNQWIDNLIAQP